MNRVNNILNIEFGKKFTSVDFEFFLETYFNNCSKYEHIVFHLENIEWIALEEITFLFAWIRYIKLKHAKLISIKVDLPLLNPQEDTDSYRRKKQRLLNLWNVWKIWQKCELNISTETNTDSSINKYVDKFQYDSHWHHIVPFTKLDANSINDFIDLREKVEKNIYERFDLDAQIEQILEKYSSLTPFENKALNGIISTELFLNSIIHAYKPDDIYKECYFAISLRNKINKDDYKEKRVEAGEEISDNEIKRRSNFILAENLKEKHLDEQPYFEDNNSKGFSSNDSFIEFTFLDFGCGIPSNLKEQYLKSDIKSLPVSKKHYEQNINNEFVVCEDSRIIEYAFLLDTSSNPFDKRLEINDYVPRGLFFLVDIIRRYKGLLIVRSAKGKVIYDFKNTNIISESVRFSKSDSNLVHFHGTLFSIYLPAKSEKDLFYSKLEINLENNFKNDNKRDINKIIEYININEIIKLNKSHLNGGGLTEIYNNTFKKLNEKIDFFKFKYCTIYIDFSGTENIEIINRKLYFYLCSTPRFNSFTKVIIVHPSNLGELYLTQQAIKHAKLPIYRPIPCFIYDNQKKIHIIWLGITEAQDEELLNNSVLLKNTKSYNIDKYSNRSELAGNVIVIDESDFVSVNIDNISNILEHYSSRFIYNEIPKLFLEKFLLNDSAVTNQPKIIQEDELHIYWTSGGYYQEKFITLIDLLYSNETINIGNRGETTDEHFGERVSRYLIEKYNYNNDLPLDIDYIVTVTLSSQLLGKHIKDMYHRLGLVKYNQKGPELIRLANYHEFTVEKAFIRIKEKKRILIVNDVISTGKLSFDLYYKLIELKEANIIAIFTLIDSRDKDSNEVKHYFDDEIDKKKTISLIDLPIRKYKSKKALTEKGERRIISIDPVINAPSMMKLERSMGNNILYFEKKEKGNEDFLNNFIDVEQLWVGHFHHNVAHHLYYFKTHQILLSGKGELLLKEIFKFVSDEFAQDEINYVFHPMFSAIEALSNRKLKEILSEFPNFNIFPLARIDTPKGWRFTFPPKLLNARGWNFTKRNVLIIDDGSCSGDTILQMIDSISMIEVNKIVVVSIIARLEDFQREFFSRLSSVKGYKKFNNHVVSKLDTWENLSEKYNIPKDVLLKNNKLTLTLGETIGIPQTDVNYKEVPLRIFFGVHFHIPVYSPLKHCPFCEELEVLNNELNSNITPPESVRKYIEKRIIEISLYETDGTPLNKVSKQYSGIPYYFPNNIDLKKLFLARDAIGKIDTYRLYMDYIKDSYDKVELDYYLAVILHECRLIESISHLLPHLKAKLKCAVKNRIGLKSSDNTVNLTLEWDGIQIIKALFLLDTELFYDLTAIKTIADYVELNNSGTINYFVYCFWKIIKEKNKQSIIIPLLFQLWDDLKEESKLKKAWGNFCIWISNHTAQTFSEGNSFQYLRGFYLAKKNEYPNHLTIGNEFIKLKTSALSLQVIFEEAPFKVDATSDYQKLFDLYQSAREKLEHPFLNILQRNDFIEIIRLCGLYDSFYSEENAAFLIFSRIEKLLNSEANLHNTKLLISEFNHFNNTYLNNKSVFGRFFLNHESNISEIISSIQKEFLSEFKTNSIILQLDTRVEGELFSSIHPLCLTLIVEEFFKNCLKHTQRIKRALGKEILKKNTMLIDSQPFEDKIKLTCKHCVNLPQSKDKELPLSGLGHVKKIVEFFNGTFNHDDNLEYFLVTISIPKAIRDYNL